MTRKKKGAEAIVVWVLLIGFVIALTTAVFIFEKQKAKELGERAVISGLAKLECNDVAVNNPSCTGASGCVIIVANAGRRSLAGFILRDQNGNKAEFGFHVTPETADFPMKPGIILQSNPNERARLDLETKIEIVPLIIVSNKIYACNEKIINASAICNCGA